MLKKKKTFKNRLVSILYKKALSSNKCLASVTSTAYGHSLNKELGIEHNYFLIRDVFYESYKQHNDFVVNKSTVFCGGHNGRDWRFILEIAKSMPDVQFNLVMPKKVYDKYKLSITENINVSYNISYKDFLDAICHSSLVCLPLDTEAPAGLIVMFQAAANKKFVITTDTVTTQEYITENRGLRLKNNLNEWVESIRYFLNNKIIANEYADNLYFFLKHECSEERFVSEVEKMIKHLTVMGKL
jgi:glycosyltransferase involved in cell wall biosynthesis